MKWTLPKRQTIVHKYGTLGGSAPTHAAMLSDVPTDEHDIKPSLEDCTYEYNDTEVSILFDCVAYSSSLALGRDLS
jgi:hypothetical protein